MAWNAVARHPARLSRVASRRVGRENPSLAAFVSVWRAQNAPVAVPRASGIGYASYQPKAVKRAASSRGAGHTYTTCALPQGAETPTNRRQDGRTGRRCGGALHAPPHESRLAKRHLGDLHGPGDGMLVPLQPEHGRVALGRLGGRAGARALRGERPVPSQCEPLIHR